MNPQVIKRFATYLGVLTFVVFTAWAVSEMFFNQPPGDFHTREGDLRLSEGSYEKAMESFDQALQKMPNHRGALMGRALVYLQTERYPEAIAELTHLIGYLKENLDLKDPTGNALMAAAYANRGIVHDRTEKYEKALADYIDALKIDEDSVSGPGLVDRVVYGTPNPATVRKRALYIKAQLALPEGKRLLRAPHLDKKQRTYKP